MAAPATCPNVAVLQQFGLGQLPSAEIERVAEHVERCEPCTRTLDGFRDSDTLVELMSAQAILAGDPRGEAVDTLIERLKALHPPVAAPHAENLKTTADDTPRQLDGPSLKPFAAEATADHSSVVSADDLSADPTGTHGPTGGVKFGFLASPERPDEIGRLGPYRILRELGAGGMGIVFHAEDTELLRPVALKVINPARAVGASARQRFLQEARGNAAVTHDHIVTIYRVGEDRGVPYLAMQLLPGETLEARLKREGKLPVAEVLRIGREIGEGLTAAHARGLIHRDIKPSNIWLEAPSHRVKILDFGLVRTSQALDQPESAPKPPNPAVAMDGRLTQEGSVLGTPAYMAPEQAAGQDIDARADLFSLGCVLYILCTGQLAFPRDRLTGKLTALQYHQPLPPYQVSPDVPAGLSDLVMRLLAKSAEDRPSSARAVVEALEGGLPRAPLRRRTPWRPLLVGAAVLLFVALAAWGIRSLIPELPPDIQPAAPPEVGPSLPPGASLHLVEQKGGTVKLRATATGAGKNHPVTALRLLLNRQPLPNVWISEFDRARTGPRWNGRSKFRKGSTSWRSLRAAATSPPFPSRS